MATPLANFFTRIGFEVDKSSIRDVEKNLERLESRIKSMANSFQSITNAPAVRAATRLANAEARRITAEMNLNKQNMSVEKLKQQNILEGTRLERNKQMTAKVVEQSRLQELRNKAQEFRQQHSASRVRVNNHGGMSFGIPMDSVKGAVGAVAGIETARRFAQQAFRVGNFQIAQPAQFEFVTGSAEEAQKEIAFLNSEVDRLSLNMMDANKQYLKLFAAGGKKIGSEKTRELFSGFQNLATMLGLSGDAQNRGLNAFVQMISKDQVYAEELRSQLSEALPGAVNIFADALFGGDTKKLFKEMEEGRVRMEEIIKVIEYMRKLTDDKKVAEYVKKSPEKAFQRMSNAWMRFIMEVNNAGLLDAMTAALDGAADAIKAITPYVKIIAQLFKDIWTVAKPLLAIWVALWGYKKLLPLINYLTKTKIGLSLFSKGAVAATAASNGFITAQFMMGAALSKLNTIFKRSIVILALAAIIDLIETLQGKQTILSDMMDAGGWSGNIAKGFTAFGRLFQGLGELIGQTIAAIFTGDWGQFDFSDFKQDMLNLFPFDEWWKNWKSLLKVILAAGKAAMSPTNPLAWADLYNAYQDHETFKYMRDMGMNNYNAKSAAMAPVNLARQNPNVTTHMNVTIPINGTGLDPQAISKAVAEQLNITFLQAQSNHTNWHVVNR